MERLLRWWIGNVPDGNIPYNLWRTFRTDLLGWVLIGAILTAVGTVAIYGVRSRRLTIRTPMDPFRPYSPMGWLVLAVAPAVFVFFFHVVRYRKLFASIAKTPLESPVGGAMLAAVITAVLTLFLTLLGIWIPGVTPRKFHYHPRWPMRLLHRRMR